MLDIKEAFHYLGLQRKMYFDSVLNELELNLMEIEILAYLNEYPENNTFTAIMKSKGYAKSYVSKAISNLVNQEYIMKKGMEDNKKVYKLYLLDKSTVVLEAYEACIKAFRKEAFRDISEEDLETFERVLNKISENMTEH